MRPIQTCGAMTLGVSIVLIFLYTTLNLESSYSFKREGVDSPKREGVGSPKREGVDSPKREGVDSPKREGVDSPKREGVDSPKREGVDSPKREGVDSPKREGVDSPKREGVDSPKREGVDSPKPPSIHIRDVAAPLSFVHNVSVSADFRDVIPQNGAYWNRLVYSALSHLDKGGKLFSQPSHCKEANQELLQTNIHDFNSYPLLFRSFLQWMNCRSPAVLINQPDKCISIEGGSKNPAFLLFAIKSTPANFEQRQAVRETWGQEGVYENDLGVRVLFLLGRSSPDDPDLSSLLSYEAKHFGDILQWDFQESFLNLTLKMNAFLHWATKHCPHASFVFSGDDDVFVNTLALVKYLQSLEADKTSKLYVGHAISQSSPLRDSKSKYYIPLSFYDGAYPTYAGGGGFLFSGALLKSLYSVFHIIPFFPIDDVYTGMCFKALGISPEGHAGFQTFDIRAEDRDNLCVYKELILVHQRSPQQIKKLWNGSRSPLLTC